MPAGSRPPPARARRVVPLDLALPRLRRDEVAAQRAWLARVPPLDPGALAGDAGALLGAPVHLADPGAPRPAEGAPADPTGDTIWLAPGDEAGPTCAVTLPAPLRDAAVDLLLGGDGRAPGAAAPPRSLVRGVALYAAARLLDAAGAGDWRAWDVTPGPPRPPPAGGAARSLRVRLGDRWHTVVVWSFPRTGPPASAAPLPGWARALPLPLSVRIARGAIPAARLAAATPGDVFLPDEAWARRAGPGAPLVGHARASVAGGRRATLSCTVDATGLRLRTISLAADAPRPAGAEEVRRVTKDGDEPDTGREATPALDDLAALGDAAVDVHVEIARLRLPLEELLALRPGALLATGAAPGREVTLRVGDRAIARGELVDVDGELGVRLLRVGGA